MNLLPIETAPKDGTWILLFGPSGCVSYPLRCCVGHWDPDRKSSPTWRTHNHDPFSYFSETAPTHWCPIPSIPQDVVLPEKTIAKKGGCYYCPECGHKFWNVKTDSGEYEPAAFLCHYCLADTVR